jgi:VCBS repeat-containing protein
LTDEDATTPISGDLDIDTDKATAPDFVPDTQSTQHGTFTIDADGHWSFTVDRAGTETMVAGATETFTVHTTDGTTRELSIIIDADNDPGVLSEASRQPSTGPAHAVGGQLEITDLDDPAHYMFLLPGARPSASHDFDVAGTYGTFHMDATSGSWTYTPDPARLTQISAGQTASETFEVFGKSRWASTNTLEIQLEIDDQGNARVAQVVRDVSSISVTEDDQKAMQGGNLAQHGTLDAVDPADPLPTAPLQGAYGTFTVTADGDWSYTADNSQAAIQGLDQGDSLTDRVTVTTAGGATYALEVQIKGTDEVSASHADAPETTLTEDVTITLDYSPQEGGAVALADAVSMSHDSISTELHTASDQSDAVTGAADPDDASHPVATGEDGHITDVSDADPSLSDGAPVHPADMPDPSSVDPDPLSHYLGAVGAVDHTAHPTSVPDTMAPYIDAVGAAPSDFIDPHTGVTLQDPAFIDASHDDDHNAPASDVLQTPTDDLTDLSDDILEHNAADPVDHNHNG